MDRGRWCCCCCTCEYESLWHINADDFCGSTTPLTQIQNTCSKRLNTNEWMNVLVCRLIRAYTHLMLRQIKYVIQFTRFAGLFFCRDCIYKYIWGFVDVSHRFRFRPGSVFGLGRKIDAHHSRKPTSNKWKNHNNPSCSCPFRTFIYKYKQLRIICGPLKLVVNQKSTSFFSKQSIQCVVDIAIRSFVYTCQ